MTQPAAISNLAASEETTVVTTTNKPYVQAVKLSIEMPPIVPIHNWD